MTVDSVEARPSLAARARTRLRTRGTTPVLAGSALSGLGAYLFQVLGTRALGEEAYAPIGVLWTIQYLALSIALFPSEAYVTREATIHGVAGEGSSAAAWRAGRHLAPWLGALCLLLLGVTLAFRTPLYGSGDLLLPVVGAVTVACYAVFVVVRGAFAGTVRFGEYGAATGGESILRLLLAAPVLLAVPRTGTLALTLPAGVVLTTAYFLRRARRQPPPHLPVVPAAETDDEAARAATPSGEDAPALPTLEGAPAGTGRYLAATLTATACSQTLLAAGPLAVIPLGAGAALISVVFVTTTAARAPLVFAFGGILSRVLPPLTRVARAGDVPRLSRVATRTVLAAVLLALLGAAAGWLLGPPLIALFFGDAFAPSPLFAALTGAGVILCTAALGLNQLLIAMESERLLVLPWLTALAVGVTLVVSTGGFDPSLRVGLATVAGEATALAGLLLAARIATGRRRAAAGMHTELDATAGGRS